MLVGKRDVLREMDLIDDNDIRATGYFNDTYATFNVKYSMQIISAYNKEFQGAIVLGRSKEDGDFSDKELYMMEIINKHLSLKLYKLSHRSPSDGNVYTHLDEKIYEMAEDSMLTKRETEVVFKVVKESMSNEEICSDLCITAHTLNKHLSNIYMKCGVNSRVALIQKFFHKFVIAARQVTTSPAAFFLSYFILFLSYYLCVCSLLIIHFRKLGSYFSSFFVFCTKYSFLMPYNTQINKNAAVQQHLSYS